MSRLRKEVKCTVTVIQAFSTAMRECNGGCLDFYAKAAAIPMSFYGGTTVQIGSRIYTGARALQISRQMFNQRMSRINTVLRQQFDRNIPDGLADAVTRQLKTGELVGGRDHIGKAHSALRFVNRQMKQIRNSHSMLKRHKDAALQRLQTYRDKIDDALKTPKN